jgi:hypothetical protein
LSAGEAGSLQPDPGAAARGICCAHGLPISFPPHPAIGGPSPAALEPAAIPLRSAFSAAT